MTTLSSQAPHRQVRLCPWDGQLTDREGICESCERRLQLTNVYTTEGVAPMPLYVLPRLRNVRNAALNIYRVFALMCERGVIANWIRPDIAAYAVETGMTRQAVGRAIAHMVAWGWVEARKTGLRRKNSPKEYRLALLPKL